MLLLRIQPVEAHVLCAVVSRRIVKGVDHIEGGRIRHHPPRRFKHRGGLVRRGQAVLESEQTVVHQVLRNRTEVQVQVSPCRVFAVFVERIHHPKLDVLHVGELEVRRQEGPLDAAPPLLGGLQRPVWVKAWNGAHAFGRQIIVWTPHRGVKRQVERRQVLRSAQRQLSVGEHFFVFHQAHQVVGTHLQINLTVLQPPSEETRVDRVPIQARPVVVEQQAVLHIPLRKQVGLELRGAGQAPLGPRPNVDGALRPFKVVDVRVSLLAHGPAVAWNEVGGFSAEVDVGRSRRFQEGQLIQHVRDELARPGVGKVGPHDGVVHRFIADVHLLGQGSLAQVEEGCPQGEVFTGGIIKSGPQQGLGLDVEQAVALQRYANRLSTLQQTIIDDPDPSEVVVDRVVLVLNQTSAPGRHGHRALGDVEGVQHDFRADLTLILALDSEPVQGGNLLGRRLRGVVQRLEDNGLDQGLRLIGVGHPIEDLVPQGLAERLHGRQEDPAILAVHRAPLRGGIVHEIIDPVRLRLSVDIDAVHAQHLDQELSLERSARDVIEVHTGRGVIVPHPDSEIFRAQSKRLQGVDVLHHQVPQGGGVSIFQLHPRHRALQHFENQGPRCRIAILTQCPHLVGLTFQRVLVGDGQHFRIVQRLAQADESEAVIVRELGLGQAPGVSDPLVVDARRVNGVPIRSGVGADGGPCPTESHDIRVARHVEEDVVVEVARCAIEVDADAGVIRQISHRQVTREVVRVFPDVGEREDVPHILGVGLRIDHVHLDPRDAGSRIHHRQALHRPVVLVPEILGQEEMSVGLIVVGPDVELLGLGAPLHLNLFALALLLAEHGGVVHLAPLRFQLGAEQRLTALNQGALKRHADVARLDVFQDVVLLPLEADVHLVLEVECRLRVVIRSEVDFLTDASVDGQLDALVKIKRGDGPIPLGKARVLRFAVPNPKIELGRTLGPDFNFVRSENGLKNLRVHRQLRGKAALLLVDLILHFVPELTDVLVNVVFEKLIQGQERGVPEVQRVSKPLTDDVLPRGLIVVHPVFDDIRKVQADPWRRLHGVGLVRSVGQGKVQRVRPFLLGQQRPSHQTEGHGHHPHDHAKSGLAEGSGRSRRGNHRGQNSVKVVLMQPGPTPRRG